MREEGGAIRERQFPNQQQPADRKSGLTAPGPTAPATTPVAAATPVIASDVGNFSDAIQKGVNGSTFVTGDARDLAAKVVEAMHPPVQHTMMAGARQTYLRDHTPERSAQRLIEIYERASAEVAARA